MSTTDDFVRAIRLRRVSLHLRQDELADLAGVSERFVYALESGKRTVQLDKVVAVLAALGLHLELRRGEADWIASANPSPPSAPVLPSPPSAPTPGGPSR